MNITRRILLAAAAATALASPSTACASVASPSPGPDDLWLGRPDARVSFAEYGSLGCPYCARFALETMPAVIDAYVASGGVRYSFRDLPDTPAALVAATALRVARDGRSRYDLSTALFRARDRWLHAGDVAAAVVAVLVEAGADPGEVATSLADPATRESVLASRARGIEIGVSVIPGLVANSSLRQGFMPPRQTGTFLVSAVGG